MSSRGKKGVNRYFGKAGSAVPKAESKKQTEQEATVVSKKGQKRKGGPDAAPKQVKQDIPQKKGKQQPKAEKRKPEEKVEKNEPEPEEVESEDESAESEASLPSDSEDSDFEEIVAKEGGSARYKAALALQATFGSFRQPGAEDEESEEDEEEEDDEKDKKRIKKLEGDFIALKGDSDDEDEEADADAVDGDDDDGEEGDKDAEADTKKAVKSKKEGKKSQQPAKKRRITKRSWAEKMAGTGAVYLGHIPHGFYKEEMMGFFSQFGKVLLISHPRSKKTGRSKGYAFILFRHKEVAEVVADTMNGYLIFGRILRCKYIPSEEIPRHMFRNARRPYKEVNGRRREEERRNKVKTPEEHAKVVKLLVAKENKKRKKLKELGIDYDFPGYAAVAPQQTEAAKPAKGDKKQEEKTSTEEPTEKAAAVKVTPKKGTKKAKKAVKKSA